MCRLLVGGALFLLLCPPVRAQTATVTPVARLGGDPNWYAPYAPPIDGGDGFFYGTMSAGGPTNFGTIYKINSGGTLTTLYTFTGGADDGNPTAALVAGGDGNFYGITPGVPFPVGTSSTSGTIFRVTPAGVLTTLHTFSPLDANYENADGASPGASLVLGTDGTMYGTTTNGGPGAASTVFNLTVAGVFTTIGSFNGNLIGLPYGPTSALIEGADGNFYGTTQTGGTGGSVPGDGTVYKVTPTGVISLVYSFQNAADGYNPLSALVRGADNNFYGTTAYGGANQLGAFFQLTPAGVLTPLHAFSQSVEGYAPSALIRGLDNNFYGTTTSQGAGGYGTFFQATPTGTVTVLYNFTGTGNASGVIQGTDGNFYGATSFGGAAGTSGSGTVYQLLASNNTLNTLHQFTAGGSGSLGRLLELSDGNFYGTTSQGGSTLGGTIFSCSPTGTVTTLHSFDASTEGAFPASGLVQDADGNLFGTTSQGGAMDATDSRRFRTALQGAGGGGGT